MGQEVMKDAHRVNTEFLVTDRYKEVILKLTVNSHPRFSHKSVKLSVGTSANWDQLQMFLLKRLVPIRNNIVDDAVTHQDWVDVGQVRSQLVVEAGETKREVDFFTCANWLLWKDDWLDLLIDLKEHFDIAGVQKFVVLKQGLQFEKSKLLDRLGCRNIEALSYDLDTHLKAIFDLALVNCGTTLA